MFHRQKILVILDVKNFKTKEINLGNLRMLFSQQVMRGDGCRYVKWPACGTHRQKTVSTFSLITRGQSVEVWRSSQTV